jgi:hypothetical protein
MQSPWESRSVVRIVRELEPGTVDGFVVAAGAKWVVMAVIEDAIRPGGFQAFRLRDVTGFGDPAPHAVFKEAALDRKKIKRPEPRIIDLTDAASIMTEAMKTYPLVTVHREVADPEICHVGRVVSVTKQRVSLLEITPDATWEDEPTSHLLSEITRVDFGGPYEEALALVADPKAKVPSSDRW